MPSVRPVRAMLSGSHSADSISTSVVPSSLPVRSPPITPAIESAPLASAITHMSGVSAYSRSFSASTVSPSRARRTTRSPATFFAS